MSVRGAFVTLFNVMLCKPRVRTLALAGLAVWACALPENAPPPDGGTAQGGTGNTGEGGSGNTAAGLPTGGTSGTSTGGTGAGGSMSGGSTTGGSSGSTSGGSGGAGASTGGASGAATGGAMSGAGQGGTGGTVAGAGMGGTTAGAGMGGKGGTMAGAGMGGTMAGAGIGGAGAGGGGTVGTPGILAHRFSFTGTDSTATDSVGTAHGTITGGTQSGGVVTLMGGTSDQYVTLPANVLTGLTNATFEVWASWTGGTNNWQRIFDFGTSDGGPGLQGTTNTSSPYFFLTPRAQATSNPNCTNTTASMPRVAITGGGPVTEDCAFGTAAFPMSALTHVAVVIDGTSMTLYIGGSAVGGPVTLNTPLSSIAGFENNWLGRSQFSSDTEYAGTISEFRIYNVSRSAAQITASSAAGPDTAPTQ